LPPFLLINATYDLGLEKGAERFVTELKKKNVQVQHFTLSGTHGSVTRSQETIEKALNWLNNHL